MRKNNPINSIYLIALALVSMISFVVSIQTAVIFVSVVVLVFLLGISLVSMFEKIIDKNVKFLTYALITSALLVVLKVLSAYVSIKIVVQTGSVLEFAIVPCLLLAIVPIYLEETFSMGQYFAKSFMISGVSILMFMIYATITEILGYGMFAGLQIQGFESLEFFRMPYGNMMLIGVLTILFNMVRRAHIKKTRRFEMLVEKYKIQIREIRSSAERQKNEEKGGKE